MSNVSGSIMSGKTPLNPPLLTGNKGGFSHPTLMERAAVWVAWGLAGSIFLTIGWFAMAPDDPHGAVSLLARGRAWVMLLQAAGLAGVTAALATVIAGPRLPHVGTFAAGLGLGAVSLRGESAVYLLLQGAGTIPPGHAELAGKLTIEVVLWLAVMMVAAGVTELVTGWLSAASGRRERWPQWQHALLAAGAGVAVFYILGGGVTSRAIQHGQACFLVAASVCLSAYVAHRLAPVCSPLAPMLAVGVMAVVGYGWAWLWPGRNVALASAPGSPFLRVLPIQFVSVGIASAIAMFWYMGPSDAEPRDGASGTPSEDAG